MFESLGSGGAAGAVLKEGDQLFGDAGWGEAGLAEQTKARVCRREMRECFIDGAGKWSWEVRE